MESLEAWLILRSVKGLSERTLCALVRRLGGPKEVLSASSSDLRQEGLPPSVVTALRREPDPEGLARVRQEMRLIERGESSILTILDAAYPARLAMIPDPPPLLYVRGDLPSCDDHAIAIVGSRKATPAGALMTQELSRRLAEVGFTIVSGLARGIDAAAHRGALAAQARTIAVVGCGVDRTYPPEHARLRKDIEAHGAVVSELPLGSPPLPHHFPRRNRIISGLSLGVVVSEASRKSGSLITARLALEQNREVFAIPGSVRSGTHQGAHGLIKQGAILVEEAGDVVEELLPQLDGPFRDRVKKAVFQETTAPVLTAKEERVLSLVGEDPVSIDEVLLEAPFDLAEVMSLLLNLELRGCIHQVSGSRYIRSAGGGEARPGTR